MSSSPTTAKVACPPLSTIDSTSYRFPFREEVLPAESGQGYALRMAAENHLNGLPQLKLWLGKSRHATLDAADAPLLHQWFGASTLQLEHALGWASMGRGDSVFFFAGEALARSYFLNRSYPRVCLSCLQADGYCCSSWDLSLTVACAKHQALLTDWCSNCLRQLSWNRPHTGICNCRSPIAPGAVNTGVTPSEIQLASWIDQRVLGASIPRHEGRNPIDHELELDRPDERTPLARLVWPLSLNGGLRIIYALATAAGYEESFSTPLRRSRSPLEKARQIIAGADEIAQWLVQGKKINLRIHRPSVVLQLLAECMSANEPPADKCLAQSILTDVLRLKQKARWRSVNPQLSQLTLF